MSKGFRHIELVVSDKLLREALASQLDVLNSFRGSLQYVSMHAPIYIETSSGRAAFNLASINKEIKEHSLTTMELLVNLAEEVDCRKIVFHLYCNPENFKDIDKVSILREKCLDILASGIRRLENFCKNIDVSLCFENINAHLKIEGKDVYNAMGVSPFDILEMAKHVNSDLFGLAFDTAHALNSYNFFRENPVPGNLFKVGKLGVTGFYDTMSEYVDVVHLSDAKGSVAGLAKTEHLPMGEGEIDFHRFLKAIALEGFDGPLVLEIQEKDVENAINAVKDRERIFKMAEKIK